MYINCYVNISNGRLLLLCALFNVYPHIIDLDSIHVLFLCKTLIKLIIVVW